MNQFIKNRALQIGFDACGIAEAGFLEDDALFLQQWLTEGKHAGMSYLERNFEKRVNPQLLVPGCKSIVTLLLNYYPEKQQKNDSLKIARYAHSKTDYHLVIKKMITELESDIINEYGDIVINKEVQHSFVDSAPVLERRWAQRSGLGWIGRHMQLISPEIGSYCFIGLLFLNVVTEYDTTLPNRCGKCTKCIDACPTNALDGTSLDARKCISYQTIENKNSIDSGIIPNLNNYILGCDICAEVCPWNKKWAKPTNNIELKAVDEIYNFNFADWQALNKDEFGTIFKNSAIKRAGFNKLKENISYINDKMND